MLIIFLIYNNVKTLSDFQKGVKQMISVGGSSEQYIMDVNNKFGPLTNFIFFPHIRSVFNTIYESRNSRSAF